MKNYLLVAVMMLGILTGLNAQVTTSSLTGSVVLAGGQVSPGATVKATHLPSGTVYSATTNENGLFNLTNMRVGGPYRVEITYVGQTPEVYDDIYLQLGQPFVLNAVLSDGTTTLDEVVITAGRPVAIEKTGAMTNVSLKQLQELPQTSRSIMEFTRLTPQ